MQNCAELVLTVILYRKIASEVLRLITANLVIILMLSPQGPMHACWMAVICGDLLSSVQVGAQTVETSTDGHSTFDNPFLPSHLRARAVSAAVRAPQAGAPPLKPTLKLYKELYRMGFSVAFITGRHARSVPPVPGLTVRKMQLLSNPCAAHSSLDMQCTVLWRCMTSWHSIRGC